MCSSFSIHSMQPAFLRIFIQLIDKSIKFLTPPIAQAQAHYIQIHIYRIYSCSYWITTTYCVCCRKMSIWWVVLIFSLLVWGYLATTTKKKHNNNNNNKNSVNSIYALFYLRNHLRSHALLWRKSENRAGLCICIQLVSAIAAWYTKYQWLKPTKPI